VQPGLSGVLIGTDEGGQRWVVRRGSDELVAYVIARRFFGGVVPETVRHGRGGTAQLMMEGRTAHQLGDDLHDAVRQSRERLEGIASMACLDFVMQNGDRHGNNWLVTETGIAAIDTRRGLEPLTMRAALRPAWRCGLVDDRVSGPIVAGAALRMLKDFASAQGDGPLYVLQAIADLTGWLQDLAAQPDV
jgi:hypothetical protein